MTNQTSGVPINDSVQQERRQKRIAGIALISIGVLALAAQFIEWEVLGLLFLPMLALIFIVWGIVTREGGLLIPGGILAGIGAGVVLMDSSIATAATGETAEAGIFLVAFAAGWVLVTLLSAIFTDETIWWALIPGGILGAIGGALMVGGPALSLLELVGRLWPLALVAAGAYLLYRYTRT